MYTGDVQEEVLTHFRLEVAKGLGKEPACSHLSFSSQMYRLHFLAK